MTEQQIIETLATQVMGWRREFKDKRVNLWLDENGNRIADWNPTQNIADAWMIVEKFKKMCFHDERRQKFQEYMPFGIYHITPEAIYNAALKAVETE